MTLIPRTLLNTAIAVCITSAAAQVYAADTAVVVWNNALLSAVRTTNPGPTITSRALAIAHTCMYDAWAAYDKRAKGSSGIDLLRAAGSHSEAAIAEAVSHAAYRAAVDLFPGKQQEFASVLAMQGLEPQPKNFSIASPAGVANVACEAVLRSRHRDGSNQLGKLGTGPYSDYTGYQPLNSPYSLNEPNHWQPLALTAADSSTREQRFLTPQWGNVKPFAIREPRSYRIKPPALHGTPAYREQVLEVVAYSAGLTESQKMIAAYWADGPNTESPPGHWNLFAQHVSQRDQHGLEADVKMFFALNNAMMDAGILAWWVKRRYDYVRPVSAVRHELNGQTITAWSRSAGGKASMPGHSWEPYQTPGALTPPFAEYVSGHSTFSAAAAEILQRFTGSDVFGYEVSFPAGSSYIEPGKVPTADLQMSWATFSDAADEAGMSRRYGGIHFRDADMEGRRLGREVGAQVWGRAYKLFGTYR